MLLLKFLLLLISLISKLVNLFLQQKNDLRNVEVTLLLDHHLWHTLRAFPNCIKLLLEILNLALELPFVLLVLELLSFLFQELLLCRYQLLFHKLALIFNEVLDHFVLRRRLANSMNVLKGLLKHWRRSG